MSHQCPVFVVGPPRSGTTLFSAMLGSHPNMVVGPETQFFAKLSGDELEEAVADPQWPARAVKSISGLMLAGQPVPDVYDLTECEIASHLGERTPSVQAMLESLTAQFAEKNGKARWVEKSPGHAFNLPEIRALYPRAKILRIVRDPRDVALSSRKLPNLSDTITANLYLWLKIITASDRFFQNDPNSLTILFEDLIENPEAVLRQVCLFLEEEFDPGMLEFYTNAAQVTTPAEFWKENVSGRLDSRHMFAWKKKLPDTMHAVCDLVCKEHLENFGYECQHSPVKTKRVFRMSRRYIEKHERLLVEDARHGVRWLPAPDPAGADKIVDHPRYYRFRHPLQLTRLAIGRSVDASRLYWRRFTRGNFETPGLAGQ